MSFEARGLRVLFAYRSEVEDPKGGAATVMYKLARELRELGVHVDISFDVHPDPTGYDLVQAFNIWHPSPALRQLRHLRRFEVPVVWLPLYLHWCEWVWANQIVRAVFDPERAEDERTKYLGAMAEGRLSVNEFSPWGRNEVYLGFHRDLAEMVNLVDHVCVTSHREVQMLAQITGWDRKSFSVTPHGVRAEPIHSASPESFVSKYGVRDFVLCVGAIDARKNQLLLCEALADSGLTLVLCGPCGELDYLELCQQRAGERLIYTGRLTPEEVYAAYRAARVHALPSFAEGAALANLEAAVAGCAMVVSNRSSEFEYFGDEPYYVSPPDVEGIARAVRTAYERYPEEQQRWKDLGARIEERFTWRRSAELTLEAYAQVLDRPRPTAGRVLSTRRAAPQREELGVNLFGLLSANGGSATAARQYLKLLLDAGIPVHPVDLPVGGGRSQQDATYAGISKTLFEPAPYAVNLFIRNPVDLELYTRIPKPAIHFRGRVNVCVPFWELPRIPPTWVAALERMDLVLAPSDFIKCALQADLSHVAIRAQPLPLYLPPVPVRDRATWGISDRSVAFVTAFEMSSDYNRKNPLGAIRAFQQAFASRPDVQLVVKVNNPASEAGYAEAFRELQAQAARDPRILLLSESQSWEETLALWRACDVYVSLHRAEGVGLGPLEAMSLGKPVIATAWSGNMDFMNERNSALVGYELVPVRHATQPAYAPAHTGEGARWAEPNLDEAAVWMRRLADDAELRASMGRQAATDMAERQRRLGVEELLAAITHAFEIRGLRTT